MDPFTDTKSNDSVVLWLLTFEKLVAAEDVIALKLLNASFVFVN